MPRERQAHILPVEDSEPRRRSARLVLGDLDESLWFASETDCLLNTNSDSFLMGSLLLWMGAGSPVHVHGTVSRALLAGLDEWQSAWALWRPDRYSKIEITVDKVVDVIPSSGRAATAFSGGVDACFTVRRHLTGAAGWRSEDLQAAVLVHGFDVPLAQTAVFKSVQKRAADILGSTGVDLISLSTNLRDLGQDWEDGFALAVASCLNMVSPSYGVGLIGSSEPYDALVLPWGSNPVTDHLASTGTMAIRHDGAGFNRTAKVALLADWAEATSHLRVCWQGEELDRNCGTCEKCMRTILNFRVLGVGLPAAFAEEPTDAQIAAVRLPNRAVTTEWQSLADEARARGKSEPWVRAIETAVRRARRRQSATAARRRLKRVISP